MALPSQDDSVPELTCIECGATSEYGDGWLAEYVTDDEAEDDDEVAVYCPSCWEEEFGQ